MPLDGDTYTDDKILNIIDQVDKLICDEAHWGQGSEFGQSIKRQLQEPVVGGGHRHCPRTAMFKIADGLAADRYFARAVVEIAPEYIYREGLSGETHSIPDYNNAPGRTFEEIKHLIATARALRIKDMAKEKVLA